MTTDHTLTERWIQEREHELYPNKDAKFYNHTDCRVCGPGPLKRGQIPSEFPHVFYTTETRDWYDGYEGGTEEVRVTCGPSDAMVVSSEIEGTKRMHSVMLDIDHPMRDVESSTPGHHHLYIDVQLPWRKYRKLLRALMKAGIIEHGFYKASLRRRATHLRPPWKDKT